MGPIFSVVAPCPWGASPSSSFDFAQDDPEPVEGSMLAARFVAGCEAMAAPPSEAA
jgi:hypothetical protein